MGSWRDVAASIKASAGPAPRQVSVIEAELISAGVPHDVAQHLAWLERSPPPARILTRDQWAPTVADAISLGRRGFVRQALDLGWSYADLFGIGPLDDHEFSGLAVWLAGRRLIIIEAERAIAKSGTGYATFTRGGWGHRLNDDVDPVLLWQFGRS